MSGLTVILRLVVSVIFGGLVGIEREIHGCTAGLRTHILVCIGSTLFTLTSIVVALKYAQPGSPVDVSRIASGVVTGIGFLGAGTILRYQASVRGLTTAASIWAVAAIGLAVGVGMFEAALLTTAIVLAVLILSRFEERMELKRTGKKLVVKALKGSNLGEDDIKLVIEAYGGKVKDISTITCEDEDKKAFVIDVILSRVYRKDIEVEIASLEDVESVGWE